ncbi:MAG: type III pantothenate kinase [Gammaproteobacteria bacterium]|nr:type III pantothenate kinase [Gammaproteobacteria bacterium]
MRLLLDVGNTFIGWALQEGADLGASGRAHHGGSGLASVLDTLLAGLPAPEAVVVSNVAGAAGSRAVAEAVARRFKLRPRFITAPAAGCGVRNAYARPEALGCDRWAAMVAAHARWPGDVLVADCGTAVTVDGVRADGGHLGGVIMPGLGLMRRALGTGTSALVDAPADVTGEVAPGLARDTADGVRAGTLLMLAAALDALEADARGGAQGALTAIITGGDAPHVLARLSGQWHHEPRLVLQGLAIIGGD